MPNNTDISEVFRPMMEYVDSMWAGQKAVDPTVEELLPITSLNLDQYMENDASWVHSVAVDLNTVLTVTVSENTTTGYSWIINEDVSQPDGDKLELIYNSEFDDKKTEDGFVGQGKTRTLKYKAFDKGMHIIEMA